MRRSDRSPFVAALALCALALVACRGRPARPPDVVLVTVDTLRADDLGYTGGRDARTPNIDRLAALGTRFTSATTPLPRTSPALASLLTGLWPKHHGSLEVSEPLEHGTSLAERLRARGYRTVGVSANLAAGRHEGLDRGFDEFVGAADLKRLYADRLYRDGTRVPPTGVGWAQAAVDSAVERVDAVPLEQPLFLWVHFFDPHVLYRPPSPWQDQVSAPKCWALYKRYVDERPDLSWQAFMDFHGVASVAVDDCRALYRAEIAYVDDEIGWLLGAVLRRGPAPLVVFTADHGESFGEWGVFFEHGEDVHDAGIWVPLVVAGRGIAVGRVDRGAVSLVDLAPTILSLLGMADAARDLDGVDLSPRLLRGGAPAGERDRRVVFAESANVLRNPITHAILNGRPSERACVVGPRYTLCDWTAGRPIAPQLFDHVADPGLHDDVAARHPAALAELLAARRRWPPMTARQRAAITPRYRLVETPRLDGGYDRALYDVEEDPGETHDLAATLPEIVEQLAGDLERWAAPIPVRAESPPDRELERRLLELGYILPSRPPSSASANGQRRQIQSSGDGSRP